MKIIFLEFLYWNYHSHNEEKKYRLNNYENSLDKDYPNLGIGRPLSEALISLNLRPIHFYVNAPQIYESDPYQLSINLKKFGKARKFPQAVNFLIGLKKALKLIEEEKPDVVWIFFPRHMPPVILDRIKKSCKVIVGHLSSTEPNPNWLKKYDLLFTSHPGFARKWKRDFKSEVKIFKPAFESKYASKKPLIERSHGLVFAGKISKDHFKRIEILMYLSDRFDLEIYADVSQDLSLNKNFLAKIKPPKWGEEYFDLFGDSSLILNVHGEIAQNYAANIRLVEAAGSGGLLITEAAENLNSYFNSVPIPTYKNTQDLQKTITIIQKNLEEYQDIATQSQKVVLENHTFDIRAKMALELLSSMV